MKENWADKGGKRKRKENWYYQQVSCWVVEQLQHPKALIKSQFWRAGFFASSFGSSSSEIYSSRKTDAEREQWRRRIGLLDFFFFVFLFWFFNWRVKWWLLHTWLFFLPRQFSFQIGNVRNFMPIFPDLPLASLQ